MPILIALNTKEALNRVGRVNTLSTVAETPAERASPHVILQTPFCTVMRGMTIGAPERAQSLMVSTETNHEIKSSTHAEKSMRTLHRGSPESAHPPRIPDARSSLANVLGGENTTPLFCRMTCVRPAPIQRPIASVSEGINEEPVASTITTGIVRTTCGSLLHVVTEEVSQSGDQKLRVQNHARSKTTQLRQSGGHGPPPAHSMRGPASRGNSCGLTHRSVRVLHSSIRRLIVTVRRAPTLNGLGQSVAATDGAVNQVAVAIGSALQRGLSNIG